MTYQEKYQELRKDFAEKADRFIKADKQLSSVQGWVDEDELFEFAQAKQEWQAAANTYHEFLIFAQRTGVNPDDEFPENVIK